MIKTPEEVENMVLVRRAVENGEVKILKEYAGTFDVNDQDKFGNTLLHLAAKKGQTQVIVQLFIDYYNINANVANKLGQTPIFAAAQDHQLDAINELISNPIVDLKGKNFSGQTLLHWAAMGGEEQIVNRLLEESDIDAQDNMGNTALILASQSGKLGVIQILIKHADVNIKNHAGNTALMAAAKNGKLEIVKEFCNLKDSQGRHKVDLTTTNKGDTALMLAAKNGRLEVVRELVKDLAVDVNLKDSQGKSLLQLAVESKNTALVKVLCTRGDLDVNRPNEAGSPPLNVAVEKGYFEIVKELLKHNKIDSNGSDKSGMVPLHTAVDKKNVKIIKELLGHPTTNVDTPDQSGSTPLHLATDKNLLEISRILLSADADFNKKNDRGMHALDTPMLKHDLLVERTLIEHVTKAVNDEIKSQRATTLLSRLKIRTDEYPNDQDLALKVQSIKTAIYGKLAGKIVGLNISYEGEVTKIQGNVLPAQKISKSGPSL